MKTIIEGIRRMLKPIQLTRTIILTAMLLLGGMTAKGQQAAVIMSGDYYLTHNEAGTSVSSEVTNTFNPSTCLWYVNNRYIRTANSTGTSFGGNNYLQNTSLGIGSSSQWYQASNGNTVYHRTGTIWVTYYYLRQNGTTWQVNNTNSNNGYVRNVNINSHVLTDNTTSPVISINSIDGNKINFSHTYLGGSYTPEYTTYSHSNGSSTITHNWYNNTDYGSTEPSVNANTLSPTYTWSLVSDGDGAATFNTSTGVLTINRAPTADITVRLTVSNISPLSDKPVDFTLTPAPIAQNVIDVTEMTDPTMSPTSAALYYNEGSQTFTSSATATRTVTTIPEHTTLTGGGNTYYYYNGTLYASPDDFSTVVVTHPDVTLTWSLSGAAASYLTRTPTTGNSTTVTHSSQSPSDLTATLTVTASATGVSDKTATASITAYGSMVAPTITRTGNTISLSTTNIGATIYYTTDGTTPSASNGTAYTAPFDLVTSPTTVKAITIRDTHSSEVASETFYITLPKPVITISSTGLATIAPDEYGATIYYTTDGTTPTEESATYTSPVPLANEQTIKAIAIKSGFTDSPVAEAQYITSGVSGSKVVLNDLEDHSWSYYQPSSNLPTGYPAELHSPDPRNVKITYKGNGQYTNGDAVSGVKVGVDADAHTFVYYKTLEKGADNKYAYTTIPNPFSVRPKNGSTYYGFSHWKVTSISGGTIDGSPTTINAETEIKFVPSGSYTTNCTSMEVVLEAVWDVAEVSTNGTFTNNYGVERMFYVVPGGNSNLATANKACTYSSFYPNGTTDGQTEATLSNRVTRYAGFSATYDSKIEYIILRDNNNNSTLNANGKNFTIGRGVSGYSNGLCATYLYGLSANQSTGFKFRIESGSYGNLYFMGSGTGLTDGLMTATMGSDYDRAKVAGGDATYNEKLKVDTDITVAYSATIGNTNEKGEEIFNCTVKSGNFDLGTSNYAGSNQFYLSNWGSNNYIYGKRKMTVEGGIFSDIAGGMDDDGTETVTMVEIRIKGGTMNSVVYGAAQRSDAQGHRIMIITGGLFKGWIAGGANGNSNQNNSNGEMTGNTYIYVGGNAEVNSDGSTTVLNRALGGNVFGAGCGYGSGYSSGLVTGNTNVVIADNAYIERGVYGGGSYGYTTQTANIYILGGTINCVDGGANGTSYLSTIDGGVYGGACQNQGGTTNITMNGGTVNGSVYGGSNYSGTLSGGSTVTLNGGTINGSLYGGGNGEGSASTNVSGAVAVKVYGGTVTGAVYGCNNNQGAPQSTVNVDIYGTDTPISGYALAAVFGGGNQAAYNGTPVVMVHNCDNSIEYVYGGGNAATVRGTDVTIYGGNTIGNVFGGCYGANVTNNGSTNVKIYGGTIGKVFGGNNQSGTIAGSISVTIDKQTEAGHESCEMHIGEVYGGGNVAASQAGSITVNCTGTFTDWDNYEGIEYLYGGANQANITSGSIALNITKGTIKNVFGGNNTSGTISNGITVNVTKADDCMHLYNVYGAGNLAPYSGSPAVNIYHGTVDNNVYGGGKGNTAVVTGNPVVTIGDSNASHCAVVGGDVYGGGDAAAVTGNTSVTYNDNNASSTVGKLFGGGNAADVSGTATVTLTNGKVTEGVYGGCNSSGNIGGKVTVNVNGGTVGASTNVGTLADVYGGGFGASTSTSGNVEVKITNGTINGDVYGGSALGSVNTNGSNTTIVNVTGGTLNTIETTSSGGFPIYNGGNVYGGGLGDNTHAAAVNGVVTVNIGSGTVTDSLTLPTSLSGSATIEGNVYGCNNTNGSPQQDVTVNVFKMADEHTLPNVFGGGNQANFQVSGKIAKVNIYTCDNQIGRVFGGGNAAATNSVRTMIQGGAITEVYGGGNGEVSAANVNGTVTLHIHGGVIGQTFAGSNQQGSISGGSTVAVDNAVCPSGMVINEFFCGNNFAPVSGDIEAEIACSNGYIKDLYGGCNQADVSGNVHLTLKGGIYDNIFGGSKGTNSVGADIAGNVTLDIFGGTVHNAIFGGSNVKGSIGGTIIVNIEQTTGADYCDLDISEADVYGGGNLAAYSHSSDNYPEVNIKHGTVKNVYGGGLGNSAVVTGNPKVTIGDDVSTHRAAVRENVYGGGNAAAVTGSTEVLLKNRAKVLGNVYGGGNQATVSGNTKVIVNGVVVTP